MNFFWVATVAAGLCLTTGVGARGDDTLTSEPGYVSFRQDSVLRAGCLAGIQATLNDRFAEAESLFAGLASEFPESPLGPLFAAGAVQAQMIDTESPARSASMSRWLEESRRRTQRLRASGAAPAEVAFFAGIALGYEAIYESRWGGWFAALKQGLRAKNRFREAFREDSTLVDALVGIGNYHYWKAARTDFINWLPFIPDTREQGLAELRRVISAGTVTREAARASLARALIHDERYAEALAHADTLAGEFPDGKVPLWMQAQANFGLYRWDAAHDLFDEIERRLRRDGPGNYFNLLVCAYHRAFCDFESGRWGEAIDECLQAMAYPLSEPVRKRHKKTLSELRDLKRKLKTMLKG